jgi:A/G-specific adenine glycosylase
MLAWYDRHRRTLPWRAPPGTPADPYRVWLSEIMLQQTTVAAVAPYYTAFLARWPSVESLAAAPVEEIMRQWAGLGYYSRARNLHACARRVAAEYAGRFPETEAALRGLPGIGPYTAAAIAAIGFGRRAVVVDGNVERVVSRLFAIEAPLPAAKAAIKEKAADLTPFERPGDYAQAMMDLGATICTPRKPACALCPLTAGCVARAQGDPEAYPRKAAKPERPLRRGAAFFIRRRDGMVLLRTRPPKGLLGGMTEFPGTEWIPTSSVEDRPFEGVMAGIDPAIRALVAAVPVRKLATGVTHVFTHFRLELEIYMVEVARSLPPPAGCRWVHETDLDREALPSLMRKVLTAVRGSVEIR